MTIERERTIQAHLTYTKLISTYVECFVEYKIHFTESWKLSTEYKKCNAENEFNVLSVF